MPSLVGVLSPLLLVAAMLELTAINRNEVRRTGELIGRGARPGP